MKNITNTLAKIWMRMSSVERRLDDIEKENKELKDKIEILSKNQSNAIIFNEDRIG